MTKNIICFLVYLFFCDLYGENKFNTEFKKDGKSFEVSGKYKDSLQNKLNAHLDMINKIGSFAIKYNPDNVTFEASDESVTVRVDDLDRIEYNQLNKKSIQSITFDKDNYPCMIFFNMTPERSLTKEERVFYNKTNKIPQSYATVSEETAIKRAVELQKTIYGEIEGNKFDSIFLSHNSASAGEYVVYFHIKVKNDIWDSRSAYVTIDAKNGQINSYFGEGIGHITDFSYIPKITKQQVLQMYQNEINCLKADISITKIVLDKDGIAKNSFGYAWHIYGYRRDKKLYLSAMLFIDSETGEVLLNEMD